MERLAMDELWVRVLMLLVGEARRRRNAKNNFFATSRGDIGNTPNTQTHPHTHVRYEGGKGLKAKPWIAFVALTVYE